MNADEAIGKNVVDASACRAQMVTAQAGDGKDAGVLSCSKY
jgi:hypothetical protein